MKHRIRQAMGLIVAAATMAAAVAQERPGPLTLTVHPLKGGAYWVEGGVSNTAFIVGDKGVIVFDAQKTTEAAQQQLAEIAKVTSKPVDRIIISHGDPDHIGGLLAYPAGIEIISQENTSAVVRASAADPTGGPVYAELYNALLHRLPTHSVGATESVTLDGVRMQLIYVAPAHTSGDLVVYLPAQKIVFAGDIITTNTGRFPVVHIDGSSLGWISTMKTLLALDADTYVSGHGAIETKAQLQARLRDAEQRREQIKTLVAQGKSAAEVEQALPEPGSSPMFLDYTQTVYKELTKGYPQANPPWANLIRK